MPIHPQTQKSCYGLKQASYNWFKKLRKGLTTCNFIQSQVDKCAFFQKDCILLMYVNDCIILGKDVAIVDAIIFSLKGSNDNFDLVDQGSIDKYLGLLIQDIESSSFEMS
jgi:hypothetical protein